MIQQTQAGFEQPGFEQTAPEQANFQHLVWDIAWFGLGFTVISRFLSLFAIHVGANAVEIGLLASLPALVQLLSSTGSGWWQGRFTDTTRALYWAGLLFRFSFLLPAFAPLLPLRWQPLWLILSVTLPGIPQGPANVLFITLMRAGVSEGRMARLISMRSLAFNVGLAISAVAFGVWLEHAAYPYNYQIMFLLAFAFSLISLKHCAGIRLAPVNRTQASPSAAALPMRAWRSRPFQRVAFVVAIMHIAFLSINAIIPLHLVRNMGAGEGFIALFGLVELVSGALISLVTPRLVRWLGYRSLIAVMMAGTALSAAILAFAPSLPFTLLGAVLSGSCWSTAAMIGLFGYYNEQVPREDMAAYNTAYQQMIGLACFIGPLVGSGLAGAGVALPIVLLVGAVLRLLAAPLIDNPRRVERSLRRALLLPSAKL